MTPRARLLEDLRERVADVVRGRDTETPECSAAPCPNREPESAVFEYVINHVTEQRIPIEQARLKVGEWQPASERAELAAFLAPTDRLELGSRDFESFESGCVVLSRGVELRTEVGLAGQRSA